MKTRADDWVIANGYRISAPRRRVADSPRVRQTGFDGPAIDLRHLARVFRALAVRAVCRARGHRLELRSTWVPERGEYAQHRLCRRCETWWMSEQQGRKA